MSHTIFTAQFYLVKQMSVQRSSVFITFTRRLAVETEEAKCCLEIRSCRDFDLYVKRRYSELSGQFSIIRR